MKTFLIIPEKGDRAKHYIKPMDILNIIEYSECTDVFYKHGDKVRMVTTLLTGEDIAEQVEIYQQNQFTFIDLGTDGEE